jgi:hypothetical protein
MSNRYKGGVISATPPTTTGGDTGTASGAWTLEQQMQAQAAGLWPIQPPPVYVEDVFSTWLYTGTGASLTITNGINLSGKGGLVWFKRRNTDAFHQLYDTARGVQQTIYTNATNAQVSKPVGLTAFNANGFTVGDEAGVNGSGDSQVSWTFREQAKFFDVVTYSGNSTAGNTIAHNLGSVPGTIIVKITSGSGSWFVYHRSLGATKYMLLDDTGAAGTSGGIWNNTEPTSSVFTLGNDGSVNSSGQTYVAYLFAHDAGGFGLNGTDNVISCGSYTRVDANGTDVNLGFEPQWVMLKPTNAVGAWYIADTMRNNSNTDRALLAANSSGAEIGNDGVPSVIPTATGFKAINIYSNGNTVAYIAIRRGLMKVPTDATKVFAPVTYTGTGSQNRFISASLTPDFVIGANRTSTYKGFAVDRLRGRSSLITHSADAEATPYDGLNLVTTSGGLVLDASTGGSTGFNISSNTYVNWLFGRASGFFDEVCYTGTSAVRTVSHNLGAAPELMLIKQRSGPTGGVVYAAPLGTNKAMLLFDDQASSAIAAFTDAGMWSNTAPTASVFTLGNSANANNNTSTYVAYLFASCPGVSKVGSYTGTGAAQTINCGFTAGSRFVLIKRTDSTGDWYVWDSARGIVAGNDPYLLLNSTAAEVTNTDYVDTAATGFEISSTAPAAINANGGTFVFLAIA